RVALTAAERDACTRPSRSFMVVAPAEVNSSEGLETLKPARRGTNERFGISNEGMFLWPISVCRKVVSGPAPRRLVPRCGARRIKEAGMAQTRELEGRSALVTGASSGIGRAIAVAL